MKRESQEAGSDPAINSLRQIDIAICMVNMLVMLIDDNFNLNDSFLHRGVIRA